MPTRGDDSPEERNHHSKRAKRDTNGLEQGETFDPDEHCKKGGDDGDEVIFDDFGVISGTGVG